MITVTAVTKHFATVTAVDGVSLAVRRGEVCALLGPNGAGKSTLIRMLLGLILPDSGDIAWDGLPSAGGFPAPHAVGYLPEDRGLYPDVEVLRTITYFGALRGMDRRAARAAAGEWLERLSLADRAREPLKSLSKGNQQKVQFITAVLHRPALAVLDEPFSGLDPLNQELFLELIDELRRQGTTVLLSAHQMQLVERIADSLHVLNRGRVILTGPLAEVRRRWTTGRRLRLQVAADPPAAFLAGRGPGVTIASTAPGEVELFVADDEPLGPLLAEIGRSVEVTGIESHPVTLHDVYLAAIGRDGASAASPAGGES